MAWSGNHLVIWVILLLAPMILIASTTSTPEPMLASMIWTPESGFDVVHGTLSTTEDTVAWINFTNAINQTGWSYLELKTDHRFPDKIQAYAAGFIEGYVTSDLLRMHWLNSVNGSCLGKEELCQKIREYLRENLLWAKNKIKHHKSSSAYWHQVSLFFDQLEGMQHGYDAKAGSDPDMMIGSEDILWMNAFGDMEDLEEAFNVDGRYNTSRVLGSGSCSALIKLLPDQEDLYVAHDTWNAYQSMLRVLKKYTLPFHHLAKEAKRGSRESLIPGQTMSFSSYPGLIYSMDDFYIISTGLVVMETTIGNGNRDLWKFVSPHGTLLEGVRTMVANRLSRSGKAWAKMFSRRNSGTYNNQWMVVDFNRFQPGHALSKGLLWVLEQLPGHVHSDDLSEVLLKKTYWPSYNTPYFQDIFNLSGSPEKVAKFGDWFSYDKTPRALIFQRDHVLVKDMASMTKLMRYNDFRHDVLSQCACSPPYSAENAISARNDLNPKNGSFPFAALGHRSHGGTDMKLTNSQLMKQYHFLAVSGPTFDNLPPFQWSQTDFRDEVPHVGHPDRWTFQPLVHQWHLP